MRTTFLFCVGLLLAGCGSTAPSASTSNTVLGDPTDTASTQDVEAVTSTDTGDENPSETTEVQCTTADGCNHEGALSLVAGRAKQCIQFFSRACDLDSANGCVNLADVYHSGTLVPPDAESALKYDTRACDLEDGRGCLNAGVATMQGTGTKVDMNRALKLFEQACEFGQAKGCLNAGVMLFKGDEVAANLPEAASLFHQSCEMSEAAGCFNLGVAYLKGQGVTKDVEKAKALFTTACEDGDEEACEIKGKLQKPPGSPGNTGASLSIGSMTVDGTTIQGLNCSFGGPALILAAQIISSLSVQKKKLHACAPKGDAVKVTWTFAGGNATKIKVTGGGSGAVNRCVSRVVKKMTGPDDGQCTGVFLVGDEKTAEKAAATLFAD